MNIAKSHADVTMKYHFRPDYSCYHVVSYDTISGQPEKKIHVKVMLINLLGQEDKDGLYMDIQ